MNRSSIGGSHHWIIFYVCIKGFALVGLRFPYAIGNKICLFVCSHFEFLRILSYALMSKALKVEKVR